jgi:hypothetical protein
VAGVDGDQVDGRAPVEVIRHGDGLAIEDEGPDLLQLADAVIAPHQDLQQGRPQHGIGLGEPLGDQVVERLRAFDQGADQLPPFLRTGARGQPGEVHGGVDALAGGEQEGTVEGPVAHLAGEVVHRRLPPLRLGDHPVEQLAQARDLREAAALQPPLQQGEHGGHPTRLPVGDGDAEQALLQLRRAVESAVQPAV